MKKNKKKLKNKLLDNKLIQVFLCFLIAIFIYIIIILINGYKEYININLKNNTNPIFTISDISVSNLRYGDIESTAKTIFGNPNKIESFKDKDRYYKTYYYDGLKLTFKKHNNSYSFMKAIVTSEDYLISRGIRVGDKINDVMNKFFVENVSGDYMYGNYKEKDIDGKTTKDNIYFARRTKNLVYYIYSNSPYDNEFVSLKDDIAQLTIKYSFGKVKKIELMYGPLE